MAKLRLIILVAVWLIIVGSLAVGYKLILRPHQQKEKQAAEQKQEETIIDKTTASSRFDATIDFACDSFCGFAALRSNKFAEEMALRKIKVNIIDDGADYPKRIQAFKNGSVQMGVFTLDALIKSTADTGGIPPATVVAFVDESRGADGMVGYKDVFPTIDSLNQPDVKIIRPEGPSDTLTRVIMSHFHLNNVGPSSFVSATDAGEVYDRYRKSKPSDRQVYVLWEPYISKMLENPNVHVLVDSSRFHGYILDVIVANRDFLFKNPDQVQAVVEGYLRTLYFYKDNMRALLVDDAKKTDQPLSDKDAQRILNGLWFKNTQDNYAQMGLLENDQLQHIDDMIGNITNVLVTTGGINSDPVSGKTGLFYYDGILRKMHDSGFFPGVEKIRNDVVILPSLDESQWNQLQPVGTLNVPPLVFARGTATLTGSSQESLDELVTKLKSWPQFYLSVIGDASTKGDAKANADLAKARAEAAVDYLISHGVDKNRIHPSANITGETSVNFVLGQPPF